MTTLEIKALAALQKYDLIHQGDRIAVGVSGGADSVALLAFLHSIKETYSLQLIVCHINHGLRGEESDRDEAFVKALAEQYALPFHCTRPDIRAKAHESGISVEEAGRQARYAFFVAEAGENGLVATAHTLNDSMETILLNMVRGTGLHGLCGIPRRRGNIIRPLLDCTRSEIEEYAAACGLSHVEDSSNCGDDYTRNRIRHRVLPELETINPAFPRAMARMAEQLTEQWTLTESLADAAQQQLAAVGGGLSRQGLLTLPAPVGDRLLLRLLEQNGLPCSAAAVERMRHCAETGGKLDLAERSWYFVASDDEVHIEHKIPAIVIDPQQISLPAPGESVFLPLNGGRCLKLTLCLKSSSKDSENFYNCPLKNRLDCDKIKKYLIMRSRAPGDRLALSHRQICKSLGKLCAEASIPADRRAGLIVLTDEEGLVWAEEFGADARALAGEGARRILTAELLEDWKE